MVLKPSSQGERQVCEGQGPLVPWLELPQGTPSGVQPQTRRLPMLAHARPCLPPPLIFCAVNKRTTVPNSPGMWEQKPRPMEPVALVLCPS